MYVPAYLRPRVRAILIERVLKWPWIPYAAMLFALARSEEQIERIESKE
jgi:hypothetical protein